MSKLTFDPAEPGHDHEVMRYEGKTIGYRGLKSGTLGLQRCPHCKVENYCMAVPTGVCFKCGWDVNKEDHGESHRKES